MHKFVNGKLTDEGITLTKSPDGLIPFKQAKKLADIDWLKSQSSSEAQDLTSENSFLRGYQGGLLNILGGRYLVFPQRGYDAPSSPGKLDICAGRTTPDDRSDWLSLIVGEGIEEIAYLTKDRSLIVPKVKGDSTSTGRLLDQVLAAGIDYSSTTSALASLKWANAKRVLVYDSDGKVNDDFSADFIIMPELSSVEVVGYLMIDHSGEGVFPQDTETYNDNSGQTVYINRNIFLVDVVSGNTKVFSSGNLVKQGTIDEIFVEVRDEISAHLGRDATYEDIVSPKLSYLLDNLEKVVSQKSINLGPLRN